MSGRIRKQELHSSVTNEIDKIDVLSGKVDENEGDIESVGSELVSHKEEEATETELGHIRLSDIPETDLSPLEAKNRQQDRILAHHEAYLEADGRALQNSGVFYDLFDGRETTKSVGEIDMANTIITSAVTQGSTIISVEDGSIFKEGQEVTIYSTDSSDKPLTERVIIHSINQNELNVSEIENSYEKGSVSRTQAFKKDEKLLFRTIGKRNEEIEPEFVATLEDHSPRTVRSLAFSPDGQYLASGDNDDRVFIFDTSDWSHIETLNRQRNTILSLEFSPNGSLLASGCQDGDIQIYNVSSWGSVTNISAHNSDAIISFNHDGSLLASGGSDDLVKIYDTSDWSLVETLDDHTNSIYTVRFSPDGNLLLSGARDDLVKIYDTSDWSLVETLDDHTEDVRSLSFNHDGSLLASASSSRTFIYNTSDWTIVKEISPGSSNGINFTPEGRYLFISGRIYRVSDWTLIKQLDLSFRRPTFINIGNLGHNGNWSYFGAGSTGNNIHIYEFFLGDEIDKADIRLNINQPSQELVAFIERTENLTMKSAISIVNENENENFVTAEKEETFEEDSFYRYTGDGKKERVTLRITMTREEIEDDAYIKRILGAIG